MKILIWDKGLPLNNSGGPSGYLWNIKQYLIRNNDSEILFYSDLIEQNRRGKNIITTLLLGFCAFLKRVHWAHIILNYHYKGALTKHEEEVIKGVDYVHFHNLSAVCGYNKLCKKLGVKTILTIHSPEPLIDELNSRDGVTMTSNKRDYYLKKEITLIAGVDYLMFPVKGAVDCFTSATDIYKDFFGRKEIKEKMFFVPTALPDKEKPISENYLAGYNIPKVAKRICYVGRHNKIKGYTYLKEVANEVWKINPDVYFVIGGKSDGEAPNSDSRWIELGWVNTISLLQEVDVFVLPNQQTYFDIIALEILRNGTPLVTTLTGGNKYLSEINNGGISFIPNDNPYEAAKILVQCITTADSGSSTRRLYELYFTMPKFIEQYKQNISQLEK